MHVGHARVVIASTLFVAACNPTSYPPEGCPPPSISISPTRLTLIAEGSAQRVVVIIGPTTGPLYCIPRDRSVVFAASDAGGAFGAGTIIQLSQLDDSTVWVTGVVAGSATLTAWPPENTNMRASIPVSVAAAVGLARKERIRSR